MDHDWNQSSYRWKAVKLIAEIEHYFKNGLGAKEFIFIGMAVLILLVVGYFL